MSLHPELPKMITVVVTLDNNETTAKRTFGQLRVSGVSDSKPNNSV
jgi:hypothetical protein